MSGPESTCPACGARVARGSLRCRSCGADARGAAPATGVRCGFALDELLPPTSSSGKALANLVEIERIAPDFYQWLVAPRGPDGRRIPPTPPLHDARADELLEEARRLLGE